MITEANYQQSKIHGKYKQHPFQNSCPLCKDLFIRCLENTSEDVIRYLEQKIEVLLREDEQLKVPKKTVNESSLERLETLLENFYQSEFLRGTHQRFFTVSCALVSSVILWEEKWNNFKDIESMMHHARTQSQKKTEFNRLKRSFLQQEENESNPSLSPLIPFLHALSLNIKEISEQLGEMDNVISKHAQSSEIVEKNILEKLVNITSKRLKNISLVGPSPSIHWNKDQPFLPLVSRVLLRILDDHTDIADLHDHSTQPIQKSQTLFGSVLGNVFSNQTSPPQFHDVNSVVVFMIGGTTNFEIKNLRTIVKQFQDDRPLEVILCSTHLTCGSEIIDKILE